MNETSIDHTDLLQQLEESDVVIVLNSRQHLQSKLNRLRFPYFLFECHYFSKIDSTGCKVSLPCLYNRFNEPNHSSLSNMKHNNFSTKWKHSERSYRFAAEVKLHDGKFVQLAKQKTKKKPKENKKQKTKTIKTQLFRCFAFLQVQ